MRIFPKECYFSGTVGFGVYVCTCASNAPQELSKRWHIGLIRWDTPQLVGNHFNGDPTYPSLPEEPQSNVLIEMRMESQASLMRAAFVPANRPQEAIGMC